MAKPYLAIDFDGTICESLGKYPDEHNFGKLIYGVREAIIELRKKFHVVIITERRSPTLVTNWLRNNDILCDSIQVGKKYNYDLLIDDKSIQFTGDWKKTLENLTQFRYHKDIVKENPYDKINKEKEEKAKKFDDIEIL